MLAAAGVRRCYGIVGDALLRSAMTAAGQLPAGHRPGLHAGQGIRARRPVQHRKPARHGSCGHRRAPACRGRAISPLRIVIADDHPLYRSGLRTLLVSQPNLDLIGEAATGEEAIELAATSAPDVVLMDITMPGIGGIEAVRQLTTANPQVAVLMLTMLEDGPSALAALQAGARGYLVKAPAAARYYGQSVPWPAAKSPSAPRSPPKY